MGKPEKEDDKIVIPKRSIQKKTKPDPFANLRKPHPVEEILGLNRLGTQVPEQSQIIDSEPITEDSGTQVPKHLGTSPKKNYYKAANQISDNLDKKLGGAEAKVFNHIYRLTIGWHKEWCQITIKELLNRTGYNSDRTIKTALLSLATSGHILREGNPSNSKGMFYKINTDRLLRYSGTSAKNTQVPEIKTTQAINNEEIQFKDSQTDDEAAQLWLPLKNAIGDLTSTRWAEVGQVLAEEYQKVASRTDVSDPAALFAEHLRRVFSRDKGRESKPRKPLPKDMQFKNRADIENYYRTLNASDPAYSEDDLKADVSYACQQNNITE